MLGAKKIHKTVKTKFRKNEDEQNNAKNKRKHHDKTMYRLLRQQEREDYVV
jgi:hypothetical protein